MNTTTTTSAPAPFKVHFSTATRSQSVERRQLRSPPPKPKAKKLFSTRSRSPSPAAPKARREIRKLDDGRRVEMAWVPLPDFRPYEYTLLTVEEAQKRDEIVHPEDPDWTTRMLSRPDRERGVGEVGGGLGSPDDVRLPGNARLFDSSRRLDVSLIDSSTILAQPSPLREIDYRVQIDRIRIVMGGGTVSAAGGSCEREMAPSLLHGPVVAGPGWSGGESLVLSLAWVRKTAKPGEC
ncbi:hypothetical protein BD413DRAFT_495565 [Trametes elegans]|nr:hypothetical protein BD413DRAFT_495565 [Trametes elegans]